jgi:hypothetical protein
MSMRQLMHYSSMREFPIRMGGAQACEAHAMGIFGCRETSTACHWVLRRRTQGPPDAGWAGSAHPGYVSRVSQRDLV